MMAPRVFMDNFIHRNLRKSLCVELHEPLFSFSFSVSRVQCCCFGQWRECVQRAKLFSANSKTTNECQSVGRTTRIMYNEHGFCQLYLMYSKFLFFLLSSLACLSEWVYISCLLHSSWTKRHSFHSVFIQLCVCLVCHANRSVWIWFLSNILRCSARQAHTLTE